MKRALIFLALLLPAAAQAEFAAPPSIAAVATSNIFGENRTDIAYRATVKDLRAQGGGSVIVLEKMRLSYDANIAPELLWQENWTIDNLGRAPQVEFDRLNDRAKANCCDYTNLGWDARVLHFVVTMTPQKKFLCTIPVEMNRPPLCKRTR